MVASLMSALPGSVAQGLIWGILAIGVYITYKVLDFADLTVDGSLATGGAVAVMCMLNGANTYVALILAFLAGMLAGLVTGLFHTALGIPPILAGILTQLGLYSIKIRRSALCSMRCLSACVISHMPVCLPQDSVS